MYGGFWKLLQEKFKIAETLVESNLFSSKQLRRCLVTIFPGNKWCAFSEICTCYLSMEFSLVFVDGSCTCFSLWSNLNNCCHWRVLLVGIKKWAKQSQNHELWWVSNSENSPKIQNYFSFVGFQNMVFSNYNNKYVKYWREPKYENVERDFVCAVIGVSRGTKHVWKKWLSSRCCNTPTTILYELLANVFML